MNSVAEKLREALELLGENGENWVNKPPGTLTDFYCVMTACVAVEPWFEIRSKMYRHMESASGSKDIADWNDAPERKFSEVREVFQKAIASAEGKR